MSDRHAQAHAHVDLGMDNQKDQEDLKKPEYPKCPYEKCE